MTLKNRAAKNQQLDALQGLPLWLGQPSVLGQILLTPCFHSATAAAHLLLALSVLLQKFADPRSRTAKVCNKQDNGLQFRTLGPLLPLGPPWAATFPLQPWLTHQFPWGGRVPAGHLVPDAHTSTPSSIPTHTHTNKP